MFVLLFLARNVLCNLLVVVGSQVCVRACVRACSGPSGVTDSVRRVDCSPPGSSVDGLLQARTPEWVAMRSSRGSSRPRDGTCVLHLLHGPPGSSPLEPPGKP